MWKTSLGFGGDLPTWVLAVTCVLTLASVTWLVLELRRAIRGRIVVALSGLLATAALVAAIVRPVWIKSRESVVPPSVLVLADTSRSMALPDGRLDTRDARLVDLMRDLRSARVDMRALGDPTLAPLRMPGKPEAARTDLRAALELQAKRVEERPDAIVVVSDGRFSDIDEAASDTALGDLGRAVGVPIHTVRAVDNAPRDASIRRVGTAGAAVAHVPLPLHIEVGCAGGLSCDDLPVTVKEMRDEGAPIVLGSAMAHVQGAVGSVDITITLDRAGTRVLEFSIEPPTGDTIAANDVRFVTFDVSRERVRILHVSGRPTADSRGLRRWLKANASMDVVAFFILRTLTDDPQAAPSDLSLIPFPVDELFQEHLASFDAVILQDFDAAPYGLVRHLPALADYVKRGGGLIMVGGPTTFAAGGYARSPLAQVLPVELGGGDAVDEGTFTPIWTSAGERAPALTALYKTADGQLPEMQGSNVLGDARDQSVVLWSHPTRKTPRGVPMPILALGEVAEGRSIALGIDGSYRFEWSELGARSAGRGYSALWEGLVGWLMRDPRFEPAQIHWPTPCIEGMPSRVTLYGLSDTTSELFVALHRAGDPVEKVQTLTGNPAGKNSLELSLPPLTAGAYTMRVRSGHGPWVKQEFACEAGGDEWADSRPDPALMERIAKAAGGISFGPNATPHIPLPPATIIHSERNVTPVLPAWAWAAAAALLLGIHWVLRRRVGLA